MEGLINPLCNSFVCVCYEHVLTWHKFLSYKKKSKKAYNLEAQHNIQEEQHIECSQVVHRKRGGLRGFTFLINTIICNQCATEKLRLLLLFWSHVWFDLLHWWGQSTSGLYTNHVLTCTDQNWAVQRLIFYFNFSEGVCSKEQCCVWNHSEPLSD